MEEIDSNPDANRLVVLVSHGAALNGLLNHVVLAEGYATTADGVEPSRLWNCSVSEVVMPVARDGETRPASALRGSIVRWADIAHLGDAEPGKNVPLRNVDEKIR